MVVVVVVLLCQQRPVLEIIACPFIDHNQLESSPCNHSVVVVGRRRTQQYCRDGGGAQMGNDQHAFAMCRGVGTGSFRGGHVLHDETHLVVAVGGVQPIKMGCGDLVRNPGF